MESSTNTFRYSPLDSSKGEIRLITLLPSTEPSASIRCEIFPTSLEEEPAFEALSYVWGDTTPSSQIFVNEDEFNVTMSLETALRHIRDHNAAITLWIDAICINQQDNDERGKQVSLMGRIYSSAIRDLLWLGEDTGLDDNVASVLERESSLEEAQISVDFLINELFRLPEFGTRVIMQLQKVFDLPVWSRIWIVQEVVLAKDVQVLYGRRKFRWKTLLYVCLGITQNISTIWSKVGAGYEFVGQRALSPWYLLNSREEKMRGMKFPLSKIWDRFGFFGATNPRDRVFGILGFVQEDLGVHLDYTKRPQEIFCEVVRNYISTTGDLDVLLLDLLYVETGEHSSRGLPSWVPKFGTNEALVSKFGLWQVFSAGKGGAEKSMLREPGVQQDPKSCKILSVEGMLLDTLGPLISSKSFRSWLVEDFIENFQKAQVLAGHEYCKGDESFDTYWRTLSLDVVNRSQSRGVLMDVDLDTHRRIVREVLLRPDNKEEDRQKAAQQLLRYMSAFTGEKCFTITQGGFSAMVPPSAKEGDVILVLFGASAPLVAKVISGLGDGDAFPERYRLIGPAYVHGFMDGEAIEMLDRGLSKQVFKLV
jgi:hypothetical protein